MQLENFGCVAGIMITASHNPPNYNGYKVYAGDGSQISNPMDDEITSEVRALKAIDEIKTIQIDEAKTLGLYNEVLSEIDDKYLGELQKLTLNPEAIEKMGKELKIVYTPLHGAGGEIVKRNLKELRI